MCKINMTPIGGFASMVISHIVISPFSMREWIIWTHFSSLVSEGMCP